MRYDDMNRTLSEATLVVQTMLGPDSYTTYNKEAKHNNNVALLGLLKNGSTYDFSEYNHALPAAFVFDSDGNKSWLYNTEIEQLVVSENCPFTGRKKKKHCQQPPYSPPATRPLELPENPLVAELTAASSSFAGLAGSRTVYRHIEHKLEDAFVHHIDEVLCPHFPWLLRPLCELFSKAAVITKPIWEEADRCSPMGAQALASPMLHGDATVKTAEEHAIGRYFDGGYAENTALAMTVAQAQRHCAEGRFSCEKPVKAILVNHGNISMLHSGPELGWAPDPLHGLFHRDDAPVGSYVPGMFETVDVPSPTIFAEAFPERSSWKPYLDFPSKRKVHTHPGHKWVDENITSLYWTGTVTTVDNPNFGVRAGQQVELLIFSQQVPGVIWPGLFDPEQHSVSPGHLLLGVGRIPDDSDLFAGHAPFTVAQAAAMRPVLERFLESSEALLV
jgi:hypothetical protein